MPTYGMLCPVFPDVLRGPVGKEPDMTGRKNNRGGKLRLVIDIRYEDRRTGKRARYRRDAQVQTSQAAQAEDRRLIAQLAELGYIPIGPVQGAESEASSASPTVNAKTCTFCEAVDIFRTTKAITRLKRTTRRSYNVSLDAVLLPRFGTLPIAEIDFVQVTKLDAELVTAGLEPSSRRNIQVVLRCAEDARLLETMPRLPKLPKVGDKVVQPPLLPRWSSCSQWTQVYVRARSAGFAGWTWTSRRAC